MMHTYDEAYLLDLNKKFIEEVLKHGDMWKTPWSSEYEPPEKEKWTWYPFTINMPHAELKIRLRWLAPIQVYLDGKWQDSDEVRRKRPPELSDSLWGTIGVLAHDTSFSFMGYQFKALKEKAHSIDYMMVQRLELLYNMAVGMHTYIDEDRGMVLCPGEWHLIGTDTVGMTILIPEECRVDGIEEPSVGVIVFHRVEKPEVFCGDGAPMWAALCSWCSLIYGFHGPDAQPDWKKALKEPPIVTVAERSLAADHSNGPAFLGHLDS